MVTGFRLRQRGRWDPEYLNDDGSIGKRIIETAEHRNVSTFYKVMLCDHYQFLGMMAVGPVATRINGGKIGQFGYVMLADHVKGGVQHTKFEKELQKARRAKWRGSNICFLHVRPNTYNTDKQGGERPLTGAGAAQASTEPIHALREAAPGSDEGVLWSDFANGAPQAGQ